MDIVLNTYGSSISCDNEAFIITTNDGKQRISIEGIKTIQIANGAQITSDAVILAINHEIDVLFTTKAGDTIGRVWSSKYGSISTIRKGQLNFSSSGGAVDWIKEVLIQKVDNQQALLLTMEPLDSAQQTPTRSAFQRLERIKGKLKELSADNVRDIASELRGLEGNASKIYFETMSQYLPSEYQFACRTQHPAMDVTNALLNYGYGVLYGKIEGELIRVGIDPYIGILHRDEYNRPVLVYDVIEIYRVWVDYIVFSLLMQQAITDEYYSKKEDNSYWLEPLGRRVLIQSINDYLEEVVDIRGVSRSRYQHMFLYVQNLAQKFKKYE